MANHQHRVSLQTILAFDALTCTAMGLLLLSASALIARWTQIPAPLLFWAGAILLPIAAFMAVHARMVDIPRWSIAIIAGGNLLWVIASMLLPLAGLITPNRLGWTFLLAQAAVVAVFARMEWAAHHPRIPAGGLPEVSA